MLTWYECTFLNTGDRVRFIEDYDLYSPRYVVPEGTPATVIRNTYKGENYLDPSGHLEVLPDKHQQIYELGPYFIADSDGPLQQWEERELHVFSPLSIIAEPPAIVLDRFYGAIMRHMNWGALFERLQESSYTLDEWLLRRNLKRWWYSCYRQSDRWNNKRTAVIKRSHGYCEVCWKQPADLIHHLTYARLGNERLSDLQALCGGCHKNAHRKT